MGKKRGITHGDEVYRRWMLDIVSMLEALMECIKMASVEASLATRRRQLTEDSSRSIITGETGFAHTRTVVRSAHGPLISVFLDASCGYRTMGTRLAAHCSGGL